MVAAPVGLEVTLSRGAEASRIGVVLNAVLVILEGVSTLMIGDAAQIGDGHGVEHVFVVGGKSAAGREIERVDRADAVRRRYHALRLVDRLARQTMLVLVSPVDLIGGRGEK